MTYEQYEALPGVRVHELMQIQHAPALYHYYRTHPSEPTPAMLLGKLTHLAILEPARFAAECVRAPAELDRRTKEGKAEYAALQLQGQVIAADDWDRICDMREAVYSHPAARLILDGTMKEVSRQWQRNGVACKGRADMEGFDIIDELKTTACASPEAFARAVAKYDYDMQASWYIDGFKSKDFQFIAVETKPPHLVAVYRLDDAAIQRGRQRCDDALRMLEICQQSGNWPGYSGDVETLSLPAWAFDEEIEA